MSHVTANRLFGLGVAALAAVFWAFVIPEHTEASGYGWMKPRTLPTICAAALILLGFLHAAMPRGAVTLEGREIGRAAVISLATLAAIWGMARWGYLAAAPALALALMLFAGERRLLWLAAGVIGTPAFIWVMSELVLGRPLP